MIESYKNLKKKVSDYWGLAENTSARCGKGFHWTESPMVIERINEKISGDKNIDWVTYVIGKYFSDKPGTRYGLSLGCGIGNLEQAFQRKGIFKEMDAVDISEGAISQAIRVAEKEGLKVNYRVGDIDTIKLEQNKYDAIFFCASLHHISNLEHVLEEVKKALVRDGVIIIAFEYIGAPQFQLPSEQLAVINDIIDILPPVYRRSVTNNSNLKPRHTPSTREYMNKIDPSEAIRSGEIIPLIEQRFRILERKDFGGTILQFLLQDIAGNFKPNDPKDATVLRLIFYLEDQLIASGTLTSDLTFMVLKKD